MPRDKDFCYDDSPPLPFGSRKRRRGDEEAAAREEREREEEARAEGRRVKAKQLPSIPGIHALMKSEAKKDLRELEGFLHHIGYTSDSDGEDDMFGDAMNSVKIMRHPPIPEDSLCQAKSLRFKRWAATLSQMNADVDQYERAVQHARNRLTELEEERETMEQSYYLLRQRTMEREEEHRKASLRTDVMLSVLHQQFVEAANAVAREEKAGGSAKGEGEGEGKGSPVKQALQVLLELGSELEEAKEEVEVTKGKLVGAKGEGAFREVARELGMESLACNGAGAHGSTEGAPAATPSNAAEKDDVAKAQMELTQAYMEVLGMKEAGTNSSDLPGRSFRPGDILMTEYGEGEVLEMQDCGTAKVQLGYGVAYIQASKLEGPWKQEQEAAKAAAAARSAVPGVLLNSELLERWQLAAEDSETFGILSQELEANQALSALVSAIESQAQAPQPAPIVPEHKSVEDGKPLLLHIDAWAKHKGSAGEEQQQPWYGYKWLPKVLPESMAVLHKDQRDTQAMAEERDRLLQAVVDMFQAHCTAQGRLSAGATALSSKARELASLREQLERKKADHANVIAELRGSQMMGRGNDE